MSESAQITSRIVGEHYRILSKLGEGGMGEVYLAEDTRLHRKVALKMLPAKLTGEDARLARFFQEARAASALNHPNILTIHEIGQTDSRHFIATEFIDGDTLRHQIEHARPSIREALDLMIQVASALAAAHQAGIVHRDIKPENIMLRRDGYVKVLDFGLAKLVDKDIKSSTTDTEAPTEAMVRTEPGDVLGTSGYMSPEQARGRHVDARTDVFSLGVVIYEMIAGHRPFVGETKSDILAALLMVEPSPLTKLLPDCPAELNRIVLKSLRKDRDERYQTVKELLVDLKSLRQELEFEAKTGKSSPSSTFDPRLPATETEPVGLAPATTRSPATGHSTISEMLVSEVRTHPKVTALTLTIVVLVVMASAAGLYKLTKLAFRTDSFQTMKLDKLTFSGNVVGSQLAFSPDGKYAVYAVRDGSEQSLWVRHVPTSSNVQTVPPAQVQFSGVTFSRDGYYVYYSVFERREIATLYKVKLLGGPGSLRKLIDDAIGPITLSPDGARMTFMRGEGSRALMLADSDGTNIRQLATRPQDEQWMQQAWSPDGSSIASGVFSPRDSSYRLVEVGVADGVEKPLGSTSWRMITGLAWLPDKSGLILSGRNTEIRQSQLWLLSYPDGRVRRITNDLSSYLGVSVTADGGTIATVKEERQSNVWIVPESGTSQARRITFEEGKDEGLSGISFAPDGRIVYSSRGSTNPDIWIVDENGDNNRQLTANSGANFFPAVTADGRYLVFVSDRSGNSSIWRMGIDGSNPVQLTNSQGIAGQPTCSPDSKWVIYQLTTDRNTTLWKVSIDGGSSSQLTDVAAARPAVSPDGKYVACEYGGPRGDTPVRIAMIPFDGGPPVKILDFPAVVKSRSFKWDSDGKGLIYVEGRERVFNLWIQAIDGSPPKQLTDFGSERIFSFDVSRGGKKYALARGKDGSDVVLISGFR